MDPNELFDIAYIGDIKFKTIVQDKNTYYYNFYEYIKGNISRDQYYKINTEYINNDIGFKKNITIKCINYMTKWSHTYNVISSIVHYGKTTDHHIKYYYDKLYDNIDLLTNTYLDYIDYLCININMDIYPIAISIIAKNKIIINEGLHRFIICLHKQIPVNYIVLECKYELLNKINDVLYNDAITMYKQNSELMLYNSIDSIFFRKHKIIRDDRRNIVKNKLDLLNVKSGLEIGPQNGSMSFHLQKNGYNMTAIEYDGKYYNLCSDLMELTDTKFELIHKSIYEYEMVSGSHDFIVGLSIFYHLYRNNKAECINLLKDISKKTKYLFIDDENKTKIFTEGTIHETYREYDIEKIYTGNDNRSIYLINFDKSIKNSIDDVV